MHHRAHAKTMLTINATLKIAPEVLETVVEKAKAHYGRNAKGHHAIDTAQLLNRLISRFLVDQNFSAYVENDGLYRHYKDGLHGV